MTDYAWADGSLSPFANGCCVALVRGLTPAQALTVLVPSGATSVIPATEARAWAADIPFDHPNGYATVVEAGSLDGWTVVVEDNGYSATMAVAELSSGGEAVVVYRSVNADSSFQYAKNGTIVCSFDPLLDDRSDAPDRLPEEADLVFPGEDGELRPISQSLRLAERLTGVELTASDLTEPGDRIAIGHHPG